MPSASLSHATRVGGTKAARGLGARSETSDAKAFAGFRPINANYIYTPNQFFELCLPNQSRGCVRLVSYLLRRTLGWLGADGRPIEQRISVTWRQLIDEAGISRGGISKAVAEAVDAGYVRIVARGRAKSVGKDSASARYELRWDDSGEWQSDPHTFRGFYTGEGRRSPIPDAYFDDIVKREPLATSRVVGIVLRQTIGYQNQFGGRRQQTALSFSELQRRCGISDRKTLSKAVHAALDVGYIRLAQAGTFDPDGGRCSTAAEYGVRWQVGSETPPTRTGASVQKGDRPARSPRSKKATGTAVQKTHRPRSTNPTGVGTVSPPALVEEEKTPPKNTLKQHTVDAAATALARAGFDQATADWLAGELDADVIDRQLAWLPRRSVSRNRLGLLRRALVEDWPEPASVADTPAASLAVGFYAGVAGMVTDGMTVAEPTAADLRAAGRLHEALPSVEPREAGHRLGQRVLRDRQTTGGAAMPPSVASAARTHGDRFVQDEQRRLAARQVPAVIAARDEDAHVSAHREFLLRREAELKRDQAADYAHFEAWRQRQRERLLDAPERTRGAMLDRWASDEARLADLVAFFDDELPTLAAWAAAS